jgi:hypothetical protein
MVREIVHVILDLPRCWSTPRNVWHAAHQASDESEICFVAAPSFSREAICAEAGIINRIAITNKSSAVARECELALVGCSLSIPGLTLPIALPLKDGLGQTKTDFNPEETKYFDLFGAFLNSRDWPERTFLWVSNFPWVPKEGPTGGAVFRLTGTNFRPHTWTGSIRLDRGDARLTRVRAEKLRSAA